MNFGHLVLVTFLFIQFASGRILDAVDQESLETADNAMANITRGDNERFLSLFTIVRFANTFCSGNNGFNGTCYTSVECSAVGGTAAGSCAAGFGVCCTVCITTCGQTTKLNNTYWANPGYPGTYTGIGHCSITVNKCSPDICQLRLDFISFLIANPAGGSNIFPTTSTSTQCLYDMFVVSGQSNNVPAICGSNPGQHMYMDLAPGTSQFTLSMLLTSTNTSRTWKIRIAQIPCGTSYTAPDNCLQWFTSSVGTFSSFNYQFSATPAIQHLANQDYTICIRMNQGMCGICYQVCDVPSSLQFFQTFSLSSGTFTAQTDSQCTTDWIQIPCATDQQSSSTTLSNGLTCVNKICGNAFNVNSGSTISAPVYSYRKPFEVRFITDSNDMFTNEGIGFCLKYQQLPCSAG